MVSGSRPGKDRTWFISPLLERKSDNIPASVVLPTSSGPSNTNNLPRLVACGSIYGIRSGNAAFCVEDAFSSKVGEPLRRFENKTYDFYQRFPQGVDFHRMPKPLLEPNLQVEVSPKVQFAGGDGSDSLFFISHLGRGCPQVFLSDLLVFVLGKPFECTAMSEIVHSTGFDLLA